MWFIVIIICALMAFSLSSLAYTPKKTYKVRYLRVGFCRTELTTFLKARDIVDIQKQLETKEKPWDIYLLSVEVV